MVGKIEVSKTHLLSKTPKKFRITPYAIQMMCYLGQQKVYAEAEEELEILRGIDISAKQIENVCHYYGEKLEEEIQQEITSGGALPQKNDRKRHYAMLDGGMLLTRALRKKLMLGK